MTVSPTASVALLRVEIAECRVDRRVEDLEQSAVSPCITAAIPMENPYCSCKCRIDRRVKHLGVQVTAVLACSCGRGSP